MCWASGCATTSARRCQPGANLAPLLIVETPPATASSSSSFFAARSSTTRVSLHDIRFLEACLTYPAASLVPALLTISDGIVVACTRFLRAHPALHSRRSRFPAPPPPPPRGEKVGAFGLFSP